MATGQLNPDFITRRRGAVRELRLRPGCREDVTDAQRSAFTRCPVPGGCVGAWGARAGGLTTALQGWEPGTERSSLFHLGRTGLAASRGDVSGVLSLPLPPGVVESAALVVWLRRQISQKAFLFTDPQQVTEVVGARPLVIVGFFQVPASGGGRGFLPGVGGLMCLGRAWGDFRARSPFFQPAGFPGGGGSGRETETDACTELISTG